MYVFCTAHADGGVRIYLLKWLNMRSPQADVPSESPAPQGQLQDEVHGWHPLLRANRSPTVQTGGNVGLPDIGVTSTCWGADCVIPEDTSKKRGLLEAGPMLSACHHELLAQLLGIKSPAILTRFRPKLLNGVYLKSR